MHSIFYVCSLKMTGLQKMNYYQQQTDMKLIHVRLYVKLRLIHEQTSQIDFVQL